MVTTMAETTCIHCGKPGTVDVPIDNEVPQEHDGALKEIRAWSCVDCVHKRVTWEVDDRFGDDEGEDGPNFSVPDPDDATPHEEGWTP